MAEKLATVQVATAFQSVGKNLGSYLVLDGLALGSIVETYLARITSGKDAGKHVIIQQLQPRLAEDPQFVTLFLDEARRAADLTHANIGRVREYGSRSGVYFLATDYLHGHSARVLLDKVRAQSDASARRMPLEHALTLVAAVAAGLQATHEKRDPSETKLRLIHSAVWPSNIIITYDGGVKLVDMALARIASSEPAMRKQLSKGKVAYFAPEQCNRPTLTDLDRHCDIFSLGVLLYEATTGTRLFRRDDGDNDFLIRNRITHGDIPRPTSVVKDYPYSLEDVVMQALAVKPDDRHPTAQALMLDVQAVARTRGLTLSPAALSGYLNDLIGPKQEPWTDIDADDDDQADSAAGATAAAHMSSDDDELQPDADEFEEEVATTLYTGNVEDIQDAWAAEALAPGVRASTQSPLPRVSERRIALPLQADDSGSFKRAMHTPPPASDDAAAHMNESLMAADKPLTGSDVSGPIEATALDGLPRASTANPPPGSLPARRERALSRPGVHEATGPFPLTTNAGQLKQPRRAPSGPYLDIQPQSPTGPALPPENAPWKRVAVVISVVVATLMLAYLLM